MTDKLKWRLKEQPTSESLRELVTAGLLTKEEAREILFSKESEEDRDKESLKSEIKFLRELVAKLSNNQTTKIVEVIKEVQKPYYRWDWYQPYLYYVNSGTASYTIGSDSVTLTGGSGLSMLANTTSTADFTSIKTF